MAKFPSSNQLSFSELFKNARASEQPLWGTMSLQHMIEHLIMVYDRSSDGIPYTIHTPSEKLPRLKAFLESNQAFVKDFKASFLPTEPVPYRYSSIEEATEELILARKRFNDFFKDKPKDFTVNHVVFGPLNYAEWVRFHDKHVGHHLAQFQYWDLET